MFILANLIAAIAVVLDMVLKIYIIVILVRAVISWVEPNPHNQFVRVLDRITEPVLRPVRRRLPPLGGLDLSPMVVLLAIYFLDHFLVDSLHDLALRLR